MITLLGMTSAVAQSNLILNGSFADGGGSFNDWTVIYDNILAPPGGPWIQNGGPNSNFNYYAGQNVGYETYLGLSQLVATTPGTIYDVNFWGFAGYDPQTPGYLDYNVHFGNSSVAVRAEGWYEYDFLTTATDATTLFNATANADVGSVYGITGISITPTTTPEPSSLALGALGALLFVFRAGRAEQPWRHDDKLA